MNLICFAVLFLCAYTQGEPLYFRPKVNDISCPDEKSTCPSNSTCCPLPSGEFGCCNSPEAVCCSDNRHCCPKGLTCDSKTGSCTNSTTATTTKSSIKLGIITKNKDKNIKCPDEKSYCKNQQTCCLQSSGIYGCCPLENAVCCEDNSHCCPSGTTCNVAEKACVKGDLSIPWMKKISAKIEVGDITCPNKNQNCSDGQTCCLLATGQYACCPFENAVCCSDKEHCCPEDFTCDLEAQTCKPSTATMMSYLPNMKKEEIDCPDGETTCDDDETCCQLSSGLFGCCPLQKAVCCSDHEHCCPSGTTCDVEHETCLKGEESLDWFTKVAAKPKAVCCADGIHCCKKGQVCDAVHLRCAETHIVETMLWSTLDDLQIVKCDNTYFCPDNYTCCPSKDGFKCCHIVEGKCCDGGHCCKYFCNPFYPYIKYDCIIGSNSSLQPVAEKMNVCPDGIHFCEENFECDIKTKSCVQTEKYFESWIDTAVQVSTIKTIPDMASNVNMCPEGGLGCPLGQKCCQNKYLGQGCCPFADGVCCESGYQCCPKGMSCSHDGACKSKDISLTPTTLLRITKTDASNANNYFLNNFGPPKVAYRGGKGPKGEGGVWSPPNVQCSDKSFCPVDTTCCLQTDGQYGCCQYANAMCCEDKIHCCPSGYQCDVAHKQCIEVDGGSTLDWAQHTRSKAKHPLLP